MADDRLTGLDASFLHLEDKAAHMHVASVMLFDGEAPAYDDLVDALDARLHLVPRYRQRLAFVPWNQGRPRWVDDPSFNLRYHLRHTALPEPGGEDQLRALAGRVFAQQLDRDKPLWEIWLVEGVEGDRFALLAKTHHALVDGVSGVDIVTVLFDTKPEPDAPPAPAERWLPRPVPSGAQLLGEALVERATAPGEVVRTARAIVRAPRQVARSAVDSLVAVGALARVGLAPAPETPYNRAIGPHRRFTWVRASLDDVKAIKSALGGTVNDVMLATVAGALRRHLLRRGVKLEDTVLRAMVPVSVRDDAERGALGNRVAAMMAPLPVSVAGADERFAAVSRAMTGLKESGQAVGAQVLTQLSGFAPPTVMSQAARLSSRQRFFNLVVTNVPGPQFPLYLMGHELREAFPMVPLSQNQGLGVAIMSYNGRINFGLVGDYDVVPDLDELAGDVSAELSALADVAGVRLKQPEVLPQLAADPAARV